MLLFLNKHIDDHPNQRHPFGAVAPQAFLMKDLLPPQRGDEVHSGSANNTAIFLDFIRCIGQTCLSLLVPEHACPSWYSLARGFIASKYASDAKVDGDEALYLPCLYYFLRSDVKTGFGHFLLSEALNLMTSVLAAWTLGASVIP